MLTFKNKYGCRWSSKYSATYCNYKSNYIINSNIFIGSSNKILSETNIHLDRSWAYCLGHVNRGRIYFTIMLILKISIILKARSYLILNYLSFPFGKRKYMFFFVYTFLVTAAKSGAEWTAVIRRHVTD